MPINLGDQFKVSATKKGDYRWEYLCLYTNIPLTGGNEGPLTISPLMPSYCTVVHNRLAALGRRWDDKHLC